MNAGRGKLGFIGLGAQGAPMAQRMIDAGLEVVLWARRPESLQSFADTTAITARSIADLAQQVRYCAICVVDDEGVKQICDELIPAMASGGVIVIHSTVSPQLCYTLASYAQSRGLSLIDAPVSGGGSAAAEGTLTVMVGGEASAIEQARPILETFAGRIIHLGEAGSAQLAKLVNNNLMAANLALAHHALDLAESLDISRDAFTQLVKVSSGHSFGFDVRSRMGNVNDFQHGARLLKKDVRLLASVAADRDDFEHLREVASRFLCLVGPE